MSSLAADLRRALRPPTLVVGVGNAARGDDGAGPAVVEGLRQSAPSGAQPPLGLERAEREGGPAVLRPGLAVLDAGEAPERYLGVMGESGAASVLFVDAVDFGGEPGAVVLLEEGDIPARSCVTHRSSLGLVMRYLRETAGQRVLLAGVQPASVEFGQGLTPAVRAGAAGVAAAIGQALGVAAAERAGRKHAASGHAEPSAAR